MHPEEIKAAIRMKGTTPAALADELELSRSTVSQVIHGRGVSSRIANRISEIIGLPVAQIWPQVKPPSLQRKRNPDKAAQPAQTAPAWDGVERRSGKDRRKTVQTTFVFQPKA